MSHHIQRHRDLVHKNMGYCPQKDALLSLLTVEEHLHLYAGLQGMSDIEAHKASHDLMVFLDLVIYRHTRSVYLSGGNRRKLSLALALLGNKSVIFLDEPSAGMDASAKRFLWNRVKAVVASGRSVLLTSHSMEECEALCDRIGIMAAGKLECVGTLQGLREEYSSGYTLLIDVINDKVEDVKRIVCSDFLHADLNEQHHGHLRYRLPIEAVQPLSQAYAILENMKKHQWITEYNLSPSSLEDVFLRFARNDTRPTIDDREEDEPMLTDEVKPKWKMWWNGFQWGTLCQTFRRDRSRREDGDHDDNDDEDDDDLVLV